MRCWCSYLSGARCSCTWPSWCHCRSLSIVSVKSRLVLPFRYQLTRVVPDKGPLNGVCVCTYTKPDKTECCSVFNTTLHLQQVINGRNNYLTRRLYTATSSIHTHFRNNASLNTYYLLLGHLCTSILLNTELNNVAILCTIMFIKIRHFIRHKIKLMHITCK